MSFSKIKVVLAMEHEALRKNLKEIINSKKNTQVVAEVSNEFELFTKLKKKSCDILILDIALPDINGFEFLKKIQNYFSFVKVLVLSGHNEKEYFTKAFENGAWGYIQKNDLFDYLDLGIQTIIEGKKFFNLENEAV